MYIVILDGLYLSFDKNDNTDNSEVFMSIHSSCKVCKLYDKSCKRVSCTCNMKRKIHYHYHAITPHYVNH